MPASDYIKKYQNSGSQPASSYSATTTPARRIVPATISQGQRSLSSRIYGALPSVVRGAIDSTSEALFGDRKERTYISELEKRGNKIPFSARLTAEGFLPGLARTQSEQFERSADRLIRKGIESKRANSLAYYDMAARGVPTTDASRRQMDEARKKLEQLNPSKDERLALSVSRWLQAGESGLDLVGVLPVGMARRVGGKGAAKAADALIPESNRLPTSPIAAQAENVPVGAARAVDAPRTRERGFITSAKEVLPDAEKISGQYIPRATDPLSVKAANLVKTSQFEAKQAALKGTNDESVAVASELLKHFSREADKTDDIAKKNDLYDQAAEIANVVARRLTEAGRTVQAAVILGRLTPEGQVRFAAREIQKWNEINPGRKIPELTGEQSKKISDEMREISVLPEGDEKARRFQELQKEIRALVPSRWWEKATAVWKAGLLTGIKTSGLNIFSNVAHSVIENVKDVPAAGADILLSLLTGKRTIVASSKGLPQGLAKGASKGWRYLKTGFDERNLAAKLDNRQVNFKNKAIQAYVDGVFRLIGSQDQPFYYGALRRSLQNQAAAAAKTAKLKGAEKTKFIDDFVTNPPEDASTLALLDAETVVFQNRTALGEAGAKVQRLPGMGFIMPFVRTPTAVAMQVMNYSPVGPVMEVIKQISRKQLDQRALSLAIGRGATGTGIAYIGAQLFENDLISLDTPKTERERELWKLEGRKANSIKVGDTWRTVQSLGPAGPVLLIGAHFKKALGDNGSHTGAMVQAFFGTIRSFTEQTFLKGVNDALSAISDPERNAEFVATNFISSFVPTIIADIARATDPLERRVESLVDRIKSRIPGARRSLEPQISALGEERDRVGNPAEVMLDPTRPSKEISTPVVEELRRLTDAGYDVSPTLLGERKGYSSLTPEQNTKLWTLSGKLVNQKLERLFADPDYVDGSDAARKDAIKKVTERATIEARAKAIRALVKDLPPEERKELLLEYKEDDLLTKDVYKLYQEIR